MSSRPAAAPWSVLRNASVLLSLMLLIGRFSGFIREMLLVQTFGVSAEADLAIVLLTLPDVFTGLLLAGGLSAALVPAFQKLGAEAALALFLQASLALLGLFGALALLIAWRPGLLVGLFAPGLPDALWQDRHGLWLAVGAAIVLTALTGVTSALLGARGRFGMAGAGTLVFNVVAMLGLLVAQRRADGIGMLAGAVVLACLLRYASQAPGLTRSALAAACSRRLIGRELLLAFASAFGATSLVILVPVVLRSVGSLMGEGKLATINYATKLIELPLGIAITTVSIVALPALAALFARGDAAGLRARFRADALRACVFAVAIGVPLAWLADALVIGIFGFGGLTPAALAQIADTVGLLALTLPLVALNSMQGALLNASGRSRQYLAGVGLAFASFLLFLGAAYASGAFRLVVLSVVFFHACACLSLRLLSGEAVFGGCRAAALALAPVLGVALACGAAAAALKDVAGLGGRPAMAALALAPVALSFLFSVWIMNHVKKKF